MYALQSHAVAREDVYMSVLYLSGTASMFVFHVPE